MIVLINEDVVKDTLSKWLNQFGVKVYWEKENIYHYPVFKTSLKERPDLIIEKNNKFFAVEVKDSFKGDGNVADSFTQIIKYANNGAKYFIGFREINISGYLVATQNSIKGHLCNEEIIDTPSQNRQWSINHGETPKKEYGKTKLFIRLAWREAKEKAIPCGVGALLSSSLDNEFGIKPLLQYKVGKYQQYEVW